MDGRNENYIFLHGLGQTAASWDKVFSVLRIPEPICPDLFSGIKEQNINYPNLFRQFEKNCNEYHGKVSICGFSLGAVLALNYAIEHLEKVQSLILIAPQFKMPKGILYIQNIAFHLMPEIKFQEMGISKKEALALTKSMLRLDFREKLSRITCPIMIICGEKDKANIRAAITMNKIILNAKFYLIRQAGHEVNIEAPEELANLIEKFWIGNK
jgi:pimeloyl-ACP methyl ester carboxylesterase